MCILGFHECIDRNLQIKENSGVAEVGRKWLGGERELSPWLRERTSGVVSVAVDSDSVTSSSVCSHDVFPGERHRAGTGGAAGPQVVAGVSREPGCPHAA